MYSAFDDGTRRMGSSTSYGGASLAESRRQQRIAHEQECRRNWGNKLRSEANSSPTRHTPTPIKGGRPASPHPGGELRDTVQPRDSPLKVSPVAFSLGQQLHQARVLSPPVAHLGLPVAAQPQQAAPAAAAPSSAARRPQSATAAAAGGQQGRQGRDQSSPEAAREPTIRRSAAPEVDGSEGESTWQRLKRWAEARTSQQAVALGAKPGATDGAASSLTLLAAATAAAGATSALPAGAAAPVPGSLIASAHSTAAPPPPAAVAGGLPSTRPWGSSQPAPVTAPVPPAAGVPRGDAVRRSSWRPAPAAVTALSRVQMYTNELAQLEQQVGPRRSPGHPQATTGSYMSSAVAPASSCVVGDALPSSTVQLASGLAARRLEEAEEDVMARVRRVVESAAAGGSSSTRAVAAGGAMGGGAVENQGSGATGGSGDVGGDDMAATVRRIMEGAALQLLELEFQARQRDLEERAGLGGEGAAGGEGLAAAPAATAAGSDGGARPGTGRVPAGPSSYTHPTQLEVRPLPPQSNPAVVGDRGAAAVVEQGVGGSDDEEGAERAMRVRGVLLLRRWRRVVGRSAAREAKVLRYMACRR